MQADKIRDGSFSAGLVVPQRRESLLVEPFYLSAPNLLVGVLMMVIFTLTFRPVIDPDFWWHLRTGQYLFETASIPHVDIFSVGFAGKEWIAHEWLSELFIYCVYRLSGFAGLIGSFSLILTCSFALLFKRSINVAKNLHVCGAAVLLGALAMAPTWGVRPQVFSFLFAGVFLHILESHQQNPNSYLIYWLIPLAAVWVNLHAGFGAGIVLIGTFLVGLAVDKTLQRQAWKKTLGDLRPLLVVLVACAAVVVLNPNGARIYTYPFETLTSSAMMKFIEEWRTPNFHQLMFQPLALFVLALIAALAFSRRRPNTVQVLLLLGTTWAMLRSGRNVSFFVLVATPLVAEHASSWIESLRSKRALPDRPMQQMTRVTLALNVLLLVIIPLGLVLLRAQRTLADQASVEAEKFPAAAMDFIQRTHVPQPLYNEYHWGGYLIWKLYPDYRVFIDGRADVYGDAYFEQFMATHAGEPQWRQTLNRFGVRSVLLTPDSALASLLREDKSWQKVYEDGQAVIFTR